MTTNRDLGKRIEALADRERIARDYELRLCGKDEKIVDQVRVLITLGDLRGLIEIARAAARPLDMTWPEEFHQKIAEALRAMGMAI